MLCTVGAAFSRDEWDSVLDLNPKGHDNIYLVLENLVLRARSELRGFAGKDCELFWSTGVLEE
jgi:hypothetical protein